MESEPKPYGYFLANPDEGDPECIRRFVCLDIRQPIPAERWGILLGDFLNCYRAALDHAVYALAVMFTSKDPPPTAEIAAFPICDSYGAWAGHGVQRRISDLSPLARAVIQDHQPYLRERAAQGAGLSSLRTLRALNDCDKHRLLHIAALVPSHYNITMTQGPGFVHNVGVFGPVEDQAPALMVWLAGVPEPGGLEMEVTMTMIIGIDNPQQFGRYYRLTVTADAIRRAVRAVIGDLERLGR
jgi:hypothetical protein